MKRMCAIGVLLAGATVCPAITLYDNLGSPPFIRYAADPVTLTSACCTYSALATRFTVSGQTATLTGFDLALNTSPLNTVTVSIYRDSIGVPGHGSLGAPVATATFVNQQPVCVPGQAYYSTLPPPGILPYCVPIFSGTMPGNVLLTPGDYWLAVSSSPNQSADWFRTVAGGEGIASQDPTTNLWRSLIDAPYGIRVYGDIIPRAYVANTVSNSVSVIDTATNSVLATIPVGAHPAHLAVIPNGSRVYVANAHSHDVSIINTATNTVVATVPVGLNPVYVAITPNGANVYVVNSGSRSVSVIDTATNLVVATITVGLSPQRIAIAVNGAHAYVTNKGSHNVSVIDTATHNVVATVPVGSGPVPIVIH